MKLKIENLIEDLAFKRPGDESRHATNYTVFRRLTINESIYCPICRPHQGCNRERKSTDYKSWKRYRDHQWKDKT